MIHFDNCTFHDSVNLDEFGEQRVISMQPPEGEVSFCLQSLLSQYRCFICLLTLSLRVFILSFIKLVKTELEL